MKSPSLPIQILIDYSLPGFDKNVFIHNLRYGGNYPFSYDDAWDLIKAYRLGTIETGYMFGGCVYPFIDERQVLRAAQVKTYDEANYETGGSWIHAVIQAGCKQSNIPEPDWMDDYIQSGSKVSCLFGMHLTKEYPKNPIAVAPTPKAALYGALYFGLPKDETDFIWLSTYESKRIVTDRFQPLRNRTICLFPDMTCFDEWTGSVKYLSRISGLKVSVMDLCKQLSKPDDLERGIVDLSDYLRQYDWKDFRRKKEPDFNRYVNTEPVMYQRVKQTTLDVFG